MKSATIAIALSLIITCVLSQTYQPLSTSTCSLGRATFYTHNNQGSCGLDSINALKARFDLNFGFAPNQAFYFGETQCGECFQVIGPYGASDTFDTNPKPTIIMTTDYCPSSGNEQWCSGDMTHFDLRVGAWDALTKSDRQFEPFLFTFQKVACPFTAANSPVSVQVVAVNDYYLSLRPYFHAIAIKDKLKIKESNSQTFVETATKQEDFQFAYQGGGSGIQYPLTVRVTALLTDEEIDVTIPSKPSVGNTFSSSSQFSYDSIAQDPIKKCSYYAEENIYDDKLYRDVDNNHRTANDYRVYDYNVNYNLKASNAASGSYCLSLAFSAWGSFQISKKTPIKKQDVMALQFDIRSNQQLTDKITFSINGAQGSSGASNFKYISTTTTWSTVTWYMNTSDIPQEIFTIYLQQQSADSYTFYLDNIKWIYFETPEDINGDSVSSASSLTTASSSSSSYPLTTTFFSSMLVGGSSNLPQVSLSFKVGVNFYIHTIAGLIIFLLYF